MFTWPFVSRRVCGKIYRLGGSGLHIDVDDSLSYHAVESTGTGVGIDDLAREAEADGWMDAGTSLVAPIQF